MSTPEGFFVDWDGQVRSTTDCGGGYHVDVDTAARYVAVLGPGGALVHEATFYKDLAAIAKAGIKGQLVPGGVPWGRKDEGF
ncbi:MAG TPA: hypothetical protein VIN58_18190 [Roseateles sp.]